jgi:integrase
LRLSVAPYRAHRRRAGTDRPARGVVLDTDPHLDGNSFRTRVLQPALDRAGLVGVTMHGLRHAHASWLLAGGADLQVVKERLGHAKRWISRRRRFGNCSAVVRRTARRSRRSCR